jgi:hypothetical protein
MVLAETMIAPMPARDKSSSARSVFEERLSLRSMAKMKDRRRRQRRDDRH